MIIMMHFKQILVVKETRENEGRVALTPQAVAIALWLKQELE